VTIDRIDLVCSFAGRSTARHIRGSSISILLFLMFEREARQLGRRLSIPYAIRRERKAIGGISSTQ
jgi:hypothetical protein